MSTTGKKRPERASAEAFREARKAARLTQEQAADLIGVNLYTLRDWEYERRSKIPESAYQLLLLKTGQFEVKDWKPPSGPLEAGELRLKLTGGGVTSLRMPEKEFEEFATAIAKARREKT